MKKGDQILSVNDVNFMDLKADDAISYIKSQETIKLRVKRCSQNMMLRSISSTNKTELASIFQSVSKCDNIDETENDLYLKKVLVVRSSLKKSFGFTVNILIKENVINILFVTRYVTLSHISNGMLLLYFSKFLIFFANICFFILKILLKEEPSF